MKKSPNIAFYTCCNSVSFSKVQLFLRSAKKQNIDVKVLGEGLEWSANSLRLPLILKENTVNRKKYFLEYLTLML